MFGCLGKARQLYVIGILKREWRRLWLCMDDIHLQLRYVVRCTQTLCVFVASSSGSHLAFPLVAYSSWCFWRILRSHYLVLIAAPHRRPPILSSGVILAFFYLVSTFSDSSASRRLLADEGCFVCFALSALHFSLTLVAGSV